MSSIDSRPQTLPMDNARKLCCFLRHAKTWVLIYWIRSKIKRHNIVWVSWNFTIDQFRTVTLTEYVTIKNNMARKQVIAWKFPRINDTWCLRVMMQSGTNILCCWLESNISNQLYFYDKDIISVGRKILLPINLLVNSIPLLPPGPLGTHAWATGLWALPFWWYPWTGFHEIWGWRVQGGSQRTERRCVTHWHWTGCHIKIIITSAQEADNLILT